MKKLIIILFFIPLFCQAQIPQDKQAHLFTCYTLGVAGNGIVWELTGNKNLAFGAGILFASSAGIGKEIYDRKRTGFSTSDLKYNLIGAILGSLTIRIAINKGIHEKNIPIYDRWKIDEQLVKL